MVKHIIFFLAAFLFPFLSYAQSVEWLRGSKYEHIVSLAVDREGRVVTGGYISGTTTIEGYTFTANGANDLLIVKRNPDSTLKWIRSYGGSGAETLSSLGLDSFQNIYVAGTYRGAMTIGNVTLPTAQGQDRSLFVAKLDSNGNVIWAVKPTSSGLSIALARHDEFVVHADGSCTFAGVYGDSVVIGSETFYADGIGAAGFLARLDPQGTLMWAKNFGIQFYPYGLCGRKDGTTYLTGHHISAFTLQGQQITPVDDSDILVMKFTSNGNLAKTLHFSGPSHEQGYQIGVDQAENLYLLGSYEQNLTIDDTELPNSQTGTDFFYTRIDINGSVKWVRHILTVPFFYAPRLVVDPSGSGYLTLSYYGTTIFEGHQLATAGGADALIAVYDDQGRKRWHMRGGGIEWDDIPTIGADGYGATYFGGFGFKNVTYGSKTVNGDDVVHGIVGKIIEPIILTTSPGGDHYCAGDTISIRFLTTVNHPFGNQFMAYLSDSLGKFDSLVQIGKVNGTDDSVIIGIIPKTTPTGSGYRIRVSGTRPETVGFDRGPSFTIHGLPPAKITPRKPANFCDGEIVPLLASGGIRYLWSTGDTSKEISPSTEGWYSVTVWNENECEAADSIQLKKIPLPIAEIVAEGPTIFCAGGQVKLTGKGGKRYAWSNGQTTPSIIVKTTGIYMVNVFNDSNCSKQSDPIEITVHPAPEKPTATFINDTLFSSSDYGNRWGLIGSAVTDTSRAFRPTKSGTYYVVVSDSNGCENRSDNIEVMVQSSSISNHEVLSFSVAPNPAHHEIEIHLPSQHGSITVFDVTGKSIWNSKATEIVDGYVVLSIASWPHGAYYVRYEVDGMAHTRQIVKQ